VRRAGGIVTLRIKNWAQHQHYKTRNPPWIKIHNQLLMDPDWHALSGDQAKFLIQLWLVVSQIGGDDGELPSIEKLAFAMRISVREAEALVAGLGGWIVGASDMLAGRYHGASNMLDRGEERRAEQRRGEESAALFAQSDDVGLVIDDAAENKGRPEATEGRRGYADITPPQIAAQRPYTAATVLELLRVNGCSAVGAASDAMIRVVKSGVSLDVVKSTCEEFRGKKGAYVLATILGRIEDGSAGKVRTVGGGGKKSLAERATEVREAYERRAVSGTDGASMGEDGAYIRLPMG
jgi:hypothetical protein